MPPLSKITKVLLLSSALLFSGVHTLAKPVPHTERPLDSVAARPVSEQKILTEHLAEKYNKPESLLEQIVRRAYEEASVVGLPPLLLLAVIEKESSFVPDVRNPAGAVGLMQIIPRYHRDKLPAVNAVKTLKNPDANIRVGAKILAEYVEGFGGNIDRGLKRYSGNSPRYPGEVARLKRNLQLILRDATQPGTAL